MLLQFFLTIAFYNYYKDSTLEEKSAAVKELFNLLIVGGRIAIVVYHGHDSGKIERDALLDNLSAWPQDKAHVLRYQYINQKNNAPFLLVIEKLM